MNRGSIFKDKEVNNIIISNGIEVLGYGIFNSCNIKEITLPDSLITIGSNALAQCKELEKVTLGKNIQNIEEYAFYNDSNISDCQLPKAIKKIGFAAFWNCKKINIELKGLNNLETIEGYAFKECNNITGDAIIPNGQTTVGAWTYHNCTSLNGKIIIPESVTEIGQGAFDGLINITGTLKLPQKLNKIESSAFNNNIKLSGDLSIPEGITQLDPYTFYGCGFEGVLTIPNTLTNIKDIHVFENTRFSKIVIDNTEENVPRDLFPKTITIEYKKR